MNLVGSFLLALLLQIPTATLPTPARTALASGVLGGFTTYSAFSFETFAHLEGGAPGAALAYVALDAPRLPRRVLARRGVRPAGVRGVACRSGSASSAAATAARAAATTRATPRRCGASPRASTACPPSGASSSPRSPTSSRASRTPTCASRRARRARWSASSPRRRASPPAEAALVVEIAKSQARLTGGTDNYTVTREFRRVSTPEQRVHLLDCLYAVAAADDTVTTLESTEIATIAEELGLAQSDLASVRSRYRDKLGVLRTPA